MDLVKVDQTASFGFPRSASFYSLTQEEQSLIELVEAEKRAVKDSSPEGLQGEAWQEKFRKLHEPLKRLFPFAESFLTSMPGSEKFFRGYSLDTDFGPGFEINTNRVFIPDERSALFYVVPEFHMKYSTPSGLLECWTALGKASADQNQNVHEVQNVLGVFEDALELLYKDGEGIITPKIERSNVSSASHVPRVLENVITLARRLSEEQLAELKKARKELVYQRTHKYTSRAIIEKALASLYESLLVRLVHPNLGGN